MAELKFRSYEPFTVRAKIGMQLWSKDLEKPLAVLDRDQQATLIGMVAYPRENRSYVVIRFQDKEYLAFGPQLEKVETNGT